MGTRLSMLTAEPTFALPIASARPEPMEGVRPSGVSKLDLTRNPQGQLKRRLTTKPLAPSSDQQARISLQDKPASVLIEVTEKDAVEVEPYSPTGGNAGDLKVTEATERLQDTTGSPPGGSSA
eukprot:RCo023169